MVTLQQFVDGIKRDSQTGTPGVNTDDVASDILRQMNLGGKDFWEMNDWDWSKVDIALTVPAQTTTPIALAANVGRIISLGIVGQPGELQVFTEREWRRWQKLADTTNQNGVVTSITTSSIIGVVKRGRDASGNLKVLFVNPASDPVAIEGEGKGRLAAVVGTEYVAADIAVVTQPNYGYFPDEAMPVLYNLTYGRYLRSIKDVRGDGILAAVSSRMDQMMAIERSEPMERPQAPPPSYIRWANRNRGGRRVV